jgi:hypothetical protein
MTILILGISGAAGSTRIRTQVQKQKSTEHPKTYNIES